MTSYLQYAARIPVSVPEKAELALARGAALSAVGAACLDVGYPQEPQDQTPQTWPPRRPHAATLASSLP